MFGLTKEELRILKKLSTPQKVQDYLTALPINFEKKGDTLMSPRRVLREKKAHCIEGAMFAALAFLVNGREPLLMDFRTRPDDDDHVIAPFVMNRYWGAVSHTNHGTLRYRDPIYKSPRELAMSYFHEYMHYTNGEKTLVSYTNPFNMKKLKPDWITDEKELFYMVKLLNDLPHFEVVPKKNKKLLRRADVLERKIGEITAWSARDKET
jgi:hypothetical protein